jgi:hypothetical protein
MWAYVERLKPVEEAPALRFGTLVHAALEQYYVPGIKRGPHPAETFARLYEAELQEREVFGFRADDQWEEAGELGRLLLEAYVNHWGDDGQWEVIASEQTFRVRIRNEDGSPLCWYVGTFDGVWRNRETGKIWIVDHKTAAQIWAQYLILDEQASSYWMAGPSWLRKQGVLGKDDELEGILFNFIRKGKPDTRDKDAKGRALNKDGTVSKVQPAPLFVRQPTFRSKFDRQQVLRRTRQQVTDMLLLRRALLDHEAEQVLYKTPGKATCSLCGFRDMCELHEAGADWLTFKEATMTSWEPYADHEIQQEGRR